MKPFFFLTGMFRSGTTLLARMLNAHPRIACASDPYQPTLKAYRNAVWTATPGTGNVDSAAPFDDYYFYHAKQRLMDAVAGTGFDLPLDGLDLKQLREDTAKYAHDFSPLIEDHLDQLDGKTYADLIRTGVEIIDRAYGNEETHQIGFKITWSDEFSRLMLDAFPEAKTIHIVRDPRAVCASKYALEGAKYPFLFMIRHWRKLSGIAYRDALPNSGYSDRTLVVRYEDLVTQPDQETRRMCEFLELPFDEVLLDAGAFKDGSGNTWEQNTSYKEKHQTISKKSVDRWRTIFNERQISLIEHLCLAEMKLLNYEAIQAKSSILPADLVTETPEVPEDQLAKWIIPYSRLDENSVLHDMALEAFRGELLANDRNVSDSIKKQVALDADFFDTLRQALQKG